ncbi:hypothetical protein [Sulfidibacter corallicola]|nr:hypothetical protein [Sulfidibacter corallicola]
MLTGQSRPILKQTASASPHQLPAQDFLTTFFEGTQIDSKAFLLWGSPGSPTRESQNEEQQSMEYQVRQEILDLHRFFQDWFNGVLPKNAASVQRLDRALNPQFRIVSPHGILTEKPRLMEGIEQAHGVHAGKGFRIWIDNVTCRQLSPDLMLATYEEWQESEGTKRGRVSSALFQKQVTAPNQVTWLHVHETWLPQSP